MGSPQIDGLLEEPVGQDRAGRVVGVVDEHQPRPLQGARGNRCQVGREGTLREERHQHWLTAHEQRTARVHRIARVGRERDVAGVEEREVEVEDAFLCADCRHYLGLGIELHPKPACVEGGDRFPEFVAAPVARVGVRAGVGDRPLRRRDDRRVRGRVGIADPEADDIDSGRALGGDLALELGEQIRRDRL